MNPRNACLAALVAATTLFAGCAAQYRNPNACEEEMRNRLADLSMGDLAVSHSATNWRGARVVVEGSLDNPAAAYAASGAAAASGASGASDVVAASSVAAVPASDAAYGTPARRDVSTYTSTSTPAAAALPGVMAVPTAPEANGSTPEAKPTTPVAVLAQKLGLKKPPRTLAAAECTFDESGGIASFRWLTPAKLARTTPDPDADE
ncbi:hypothetical protein [Paraburkholderia sp. J41]|uniref:hypothetical protein n=1 Tax=Paraburkholderia sp. J41 TaxID=2805433 RepID=UPI002AC31833|nr:hypothetical protein [Paraburkholderia sp. J41]